MDKEQLCHPRESGDPVGHGARLPSEKPYVQAEPRLIGRVAWCSGSSRSRMTSGCVSRLP
jgi:hypothetical protein